MLFVSPKLTPFLTAWVLLLATPLVARADQEEEVDELGDAAALFSGPLEVVAEQDEFRWLESPLYAEEGYVLFSDVVWNNEDGDTCGMIWKWDIESETLSKFIPCSGLIGPEPRFEPSNTNISDYIEAGSNGLHWGWKGEEEGDLLICQHGRHRIVRINIDDVEDDGSIDPDDVIVLVDSYNGTMFNSPNDMVLVEDVLYFTDPPFGLQYRSAPADVGAIPNAFGNLNNDIGVYKIEGDPSEDTMYYIPVEPVKIIDIGMPDPEAWYAPNGVALIPPNGDLFIPITDFADPRFHVYEIEDDGETYDEDPIRIESPYRIEGDNSGFPALNDGVTYSPEHDVIFATGPGGVYMFDGASYDMLGFLRVDDLVSNCVLGGGYLWITANRRFVRIPLASAKDEEEGDGFPVEISEDEATVVERDGADLFD